MQSAYVRALSEVGSNGKFQKKFDIIYSGLFMVTWSMVYMNIILALVVIPHHCELPWKPENFSDYSWKLMYLPSTESPNGQKVFSSCSIYANPLGTNGTNDCQKYTYDKTWYESTVPSENNWVCDKELNVANIYAFMRIAEIIGSVIFGWFGDKYGRRPVYIISLFLIVLGRVIAILASQSYFLFVCGCVIASVPSWSGPQSASMISVEISSSQRRTTSISLRFTAFSIGVSIMALLYWWLREWKLFLAVTTVIPLPYLLLSWKMIESPRWFWIKGRIEECIKQLKKIAKDNNENLEQETEKDLYLTPTTQKSQALGSLALFTGWYIALNTVLQLILWMCVTMSYTVLIMSSSEKVDVNPFLEFAWQSVIEIPANVVAAWLADNLGRRYTGGIAYGIIALTWAFLALRETVNYTWVRMWWISTILVAVCRFATTISFYIISLLNMELYPTCLRQSGMSLGNLLSSGASALGPYIVYIGRRIDARLPGVILAGISIIGLASSLLLPETLNAKLPETIEDALVFGKQKKYQYSSVLTSNPTFTHTDNDHKIKVDIGLTFNTGNKL